MCFGGGGVSESTLGCLSGVVTAGFAATPVVREVAVVSAAQAPSLVGGSDCDVATDAAQ